jgi:hypothetical protein
MLHRFAGFNERSEVQNAVEWSACGGRFPKQNFDASTVCDVGFDELDASGNLVAMGMAEVIDDDDLMALAEEKRGDCASDVAGTAGNHDLHKKVDPCGSI